MERQIELQRKVTLGTVTKYANGILRFDPDENVNEDIDISVEILKEHLAAYIEFNKGKPAPFLSDNRKLHSLGTDEKKFIVSTINQFATAIAVIVASPLSKFIHNAFMAVYRPDIPNKAFANEKEALNWLEGFIVKN